MSTIRLLLAGPARVERCGGQYSVRRQVCRRLGKLPSFGDDRRSLRFVPLVKLLRSYRYVGGIICSGELSVRRFGLFAPASFLMCRPPYRRVVGGGDVDGFTAIGVALSPFKNQTSLAGIAPEGGGRLAVFGARGAVGIADKCTSCMYMGSTIISLSPSSTQTAKMCFLWIFAVART